MSQTQRLALDKAIHSCEGEDSISHQFPHWIISRISVTSQVTFTRACAFKVQTTPQPNVLPQPQLRVCNEFDWLLSLISTWESRDLKRGDEYHTSFPSTWSELLHTGTYLPVWFCKYCYLQLYVAGPTPFPFKSQLWRCANYTTQNSYTFWNQISKNSFRKHCICNPLDPSVEMVTQNHDSVKRDWSN